MSAQEVSNIPVPHLIGPVVVAVILNSYIFGFSFYQWLRFTFSERARFHGFGLRILVIYCTAVDAAHSSLAIYMLWDYCVNNFTNLDILKFQPWTFISTPIWTAMISLPVQLYFAGRIKLLNKSWLTFAVLSFLSISGALLGVASAIGGLVSAKLNAEDRFDPLVLASFAAEFLCNAGITAFIVKYMHTGMIPRSAINNPTAAAVVLDYVIDGTIASTVFALLALIFFVTHRESNLFIMFALPMGRIYSSTMFSTLNGRTPKTKSENTVGTLVSRLAAATSKTRTEIVVAVEQEIQLDTYHLEERAPARLTSAVKELPSFISL